MGSMHRGGIGKSRSTGVILVLRNTTVLLVNVVQTVRFED